ncbi:MAG: hypothetical protein LBV74_11740 [Tannerella sp.]|nr:hypothetical protein [Tannerella sp.]
MKRKYLLAIPILLLIVFCSCDKNDTEENFGMGKEEIYTPFDIKYANDTLRVTCDLENLFDVTVVDWPSQRVLLESERHKSEAVIALGDLKWSRCGIRIETDNGLYIKYIDKR